VPELSKCEALSSAPVPPKNENKLGQFNNSNELQNTTSHRIDEGSISKYM
jgi:hypothetical protein